MNALARFLLKTDDAPSAGASGALFGLVGVLFVFGIKFRHELPEGFKRAFGTGMLPIIVINLVIGYLGQGFIDNAAHLGGLISGSLLALIAGYRRPGERTGVAITWRVLQVFAGILVLVSFAKVVQNFPRGLNASDLAPRAQLPFANENFVSYSKSMSDAHEVFREAIQGDPNRVDEALKGLESAPHLDEKADELKETLKGLLIEAKKVATMPRPSPGNRPPDEPVKDLAARFNAWSTDYILWLQTSGQTHSGLENLTKPQEKK